jgi:ArsR family transcriptional regulator, arsenate/arsenite/antimonite-responsive transcriptional repressor
MKMTEALASLGALAQESRLQVFRTLVQRGPMGLPAGQIAERLGIPPATLSFHLGQLGQAGLVVSERNGRSIRYAADFQGMERLMAFLYENCCQGQGCAPTPGGQRKRKGGEA